MEYINHLYTPVNEDMASGLRCGGNHVAVKDGDWSERKERKAKSREKLGPWRRQADVVQDPAR